MQRLARAARKQPPCPAVQGTFVAMNAALLFTLALVPLPLPSQAADPAGSPRDVAEILLPIWEQYGVPAIGGAIVTLEGLESIGAVGMRSLEGDLDVTSEDLWHLGSCTKAITATLVARLVERGTLGWDTTVAGAFPELGESVHEEWRQVPIRLLLQNRGGAPGDIDPKLWLELWRSAMSPREQRLALVRGILAVPPAYAPDSKNVYSNAGFALAGAMIESISGTPWEDLLRREVFDPLRMSAVGFGAPGAPGELDQPLGHGSRGGAFVPGPRGPGDDNPPAIGPAGTVHASLASWACFARAHLCAERATGDYLQPETWKRLHEPAADSGYAMGWGVVERDWAGGPALTHSGSNTMWFCSIWLAPEKGFGVLATCNAGGDAAAKACDAVCTALGADHAARVAGEKKEER